MDSEQILINIFKQQHYDATQHKMQKIIMLLSTVACFTAFVFMIIFYVGMLYVFVFAGAVIWAGIAMLLVRQKMVSLNIASFSFMLYASFVLVPVFWHLTGIAGSAPYVSLCILVGILSMFSGKILKGLLRSYLVLLFALTVYSAVVEIPVAANVPQLVYTIVAYAITFLLCSISTNLKR